MEKPKLSSQTPNPYQFMFCFLFFQTASYTVQFLHSSDWVKSWFKVLNQTFRWMLAGLVNSLHAPVSKSNKMKKDEGDENRFYVFFLQSSHKHDQCFLLLLFLFFLFFLFVVLHFSTRGDGFVDRQANEFGEVSYIHSHTSCTSTYWINKSHLQISVDIWIFVSTQPWKRILVTSARYCEHRLIEHELCLKYEIWVLNVVRRRRGSAGGMQCMDSSVIRLLWTSWVHRVYNRKARINTSQRTFEAGTLDVWAVSERSESDESLFRCLHDSARNHMTSDKHLTSHGIWFIMSHFSISIMMNHGAYGLLSVVWFMHTIMRPTRCTALSARNTLNILNELWAHCINNENQTNSKATLGVNNKE